MKEFLLSLLSRKFMLALGTVLIMVANGQYTEAVAVVIGYIGVEGAADFKSRSEKVDPVVQEPVLTEHEAVVAKLK